MSPFPLRLPLDLPKTTPSQLHVLFEYALRWKKPQERRDQRCWAGQGGGHSSLVGLGEGKSLIFVKRDARAGGHEEAVAISCLKACFSLKAGRLICSE